MQWIRWLGDRGWCGVDGSDDPVLAEMEAQDALSGIVAGMNRGVVFAPLRACGG